MKARQLFLNIGMTVSATTALGPGMRYGLWFQGCPFSCPGCVAPEFLPDNGGEQITVKTIIEDIYQQKEKYSLEGVTISGGEPFAQPEGLMEIVQECQRINLSVLVFTGFILGTLQKRAKKEVCINKSLLHIDVLIDGLYEHSLNDSIGLRGSNNQSIHFLKERYRVNESLFQKSQRSIELVQTVKGTAFVGIPTMERWRIMMFGGE